MVDFECKGVIGSSVYIAPHNSSAKYRVLVNDENYAHWEMCAKCYSKYQEEIGIEKTLKKSFGGLEDVADKDDD